MAHQRSLSAPSLVQSIRRAILQITDTPPYCPVCFHVAPEKILERFYSYTLHECTGRGLQFWDPREMPSARNKRLLPLEPGHRSFLADQLAPRCGRILDVGCGTGNFLIAASLAGYAVSGIELDPDAATLASRFPKPRNRATP
jgi:SAM-dependent methyltransferase